MRLECEGRGASALRVELNRLRGWDALAVHYENLDRSFGGEPLNPRGIQWHLQPEHIRVVVRSHRVLLECVVLAAANNVHCYETSGVSCCSGARRPIGSAMSSCFTP